MKRNLERFFCAVLAWLFLATGPGRAGCLMGSIDVAGDRSVVSVEVGCTNTLSEPYVLEHMPTLQGSSWRPVTTNHLQSPGGRLVHAGSSVGSSGFYRVRSGQVDELLLVNDDFDGNGDVTGSILERDVQRGGWESSVSLQVEDGRLTSSSSLQYASVELPPISPYGIVKITADYVSQDNNYWLGMGFAARSGGLHDSTNSGPWFNVRGNGAVSLFGGSGMSNRMSSAVAPPGRCEIMMEYNVLTQSATLSIGGVVVFDEVPVVNLVEPDLSWFTVEFEEDTATAGHSLDNVRVEYLPRPRPLRSLDTTQLIQVTDTSVSGIQQALYDAKALSTASDPVRLSIPQGTYTFKAPASNGQCVFQIDGLDYTVIDWNGSSVFLEDPLKGFMKLYAANHVIVQNLDSVDYSVLPFAQGSVVAVDHTARTVDVQIDAGFPHPTNAVFLLGVDGGEEMRWGHLVDPNVPGKHKENSSLHYWFTNVVHLSGSTFRYSMQADTTGHFEISDRFVDLPRFSNQLFNLGRAKQTTLKNITAYSCGNFFASGWYLNACNFLNVKVLIKPGRLKSVNGDCVTGTEWVPGPWIENCVFEGAGDDICHQKDARGVYVSGNVMKNSRRYGVWLNGSEYAVIQNNRIEGLSGESITGHIEYNTSGFASRNVIVLGNTIADFSPQYVFQLTPRKHPAGISLYGQLAHALPGIHNTEWRIIGNSILDWKRTAISVGYSGQIGIYDNIISAPVYDPDITATNEVLIYDSIQVVVE
ncbi:right-handed parallel beta-helix repeat-containing protein [Tichowtungia aerotolerans]|uniref:Right handed beta helix domain-containing protein n=1 Tax=Tichowtungia aerotolerans TaxID=2697043 RepID=A0A6P1M2C1_9BACT|nr:NosD domain-containing protein [Tichowtungia aerotolerans]QHI67991.1 hypothetical protein GT409_00510 [Tichowtungia aerotolerans]